MMPHPTPIQFHAVDPTAFATAQGRIAVVTDTALTQAARRLDRLMRGALSRCVASDAFAKLKPGDAMELAFPAGLAADAVQVVRLPRRVDVIAARKAGGAIGRALSDKATLVVADHLRAADISFGLAMRAMNLRRTKRVRQR
jgi:leucyl aminopeptidase